MEVPDSILRRSGPTPGTGEAGDQDAKMFTPGAAISGWKYK